MADLKYYQLAGVADAIKFSKDGGTLKYVTTQTEFALTQSDVSVLAPLALSTVKSQLGVSISETTGTLSIADATLSYDSTGTFKFDGSASVMIPVGSNAARPTGKVGMIRINSESTPFLEVYNGTIWQNMSVSTAAGSSGQIQYNNLGLLDASNRFKISFSEAQANTTITLGNPASFSSTSSIATIQGESSTDTKQATTVELRGGNNSGAGNGGSVSIVGGYAITSGTYAGNVVLMGGESSVGNHGSVYVYTIDNNGGTAERLKIAGGTGAWGLGGENYGSAGQVLTSSGYNAPPVWSTIAGTVKYPFGFNSDPTNNLFVIPTNSAVLSVSIVITTAFNDTSTTVVVGDSAQSDRLMQAEDSLPAVVGAYTVYPNYVYGIGTQLILSISGTSSVGSGVVVISYE
jgi:hypothetical protein